MLARIALALALIALLVLGANGHISRWLGIENNGTTNAALVGGDSGVDLRAVQAWASADVARTACEMQMSEAGMALKRDFWSESGTARNIIARVTKRPEAEGKDVFCEDVWKLYGPNGTELPGLVVRP